MKYLGMIGAGLWLLAGCTSAPSGVAKSSGSIAISLDDSTLFVADADHDRLTVIDARSREVLEHIAVGKRPERVLVGPSGEVFVSNRGSRSVARLAPGGRMVEATGEVGAEPVGMSLSADGSRLLVANSMSGTVSVLDARTLTPVSEVQVGGQPWAVTALPDGRRAYVSDFIGGAVKLLDLSARRVLSTVSLEQPPGAECRFGTTPGRTPAQAADVVLSPDGERAYVAHVQSRTRTEGRASLAFAVAPALSTISTRSSTRLQEPVEDFESPDFPASILATNLDESCRNVRGGPGMDAPSSLVVDGSGEWIFVADHNSNAVAVVSAVRRQDERYRVPERGIYDVVRVGSRPTGIAVSSDLLTAYVHNALDYTVSVVENREGRLFEMDKVSFAASELPPAVERGRKLFYSAVDPRMTQVELGGVSCSSCHPDGRTDGLTWVLPAPAETGSTWSWSTATLPPRNSQALWGLSATAPYHWEGVLADLPAFSTRMVSQMGGRGLSQADLSDLAAYLETIPAPDNPGVRAGEAELLLGAEIFGARCSSCHSGAARTDGLRHPTTESIQLDTPSLRGVFATPPYLHDGSARSLREVFLGPRFTIEAHSQRSLSETQARALEAYLRTL